MERVLKGLTPLRPEIWALSLKYELDQIKNGRILNLPPRPPKLDPPPSF